MRKLHEGRHACINVFLCVYNVHVWDCCTQIEKRLIKQTTTFGLFDSSMVNVNFHIMTCTRWSSVGFLTRSIGSYCGDLCEIIDNIGSKSTSDSALLCRWSITFTLCFFRNNGFNKITKKYTNWTRFHLDKTSGWQPMKADYTLEYLRIWKNQLIIFAACLYMDNLYNLNKCMMYNILQNNLDITTTQRNFWVLVAQLLTLWIDGWPNWMLWNKI